MARRKNVSHGRIRIISLYLHALTRVLGIDGERKWWKAKQNQRGFFRFRSACSCFGEWTTKGRDERPSKIKMVSLGFDLVPHLPGNKWRDGTVKNKRIRVVSFGFDLLPHVLGSEGRHERMEGTAGSKWPQSVLAPCLMFWGINGETKWWKAQGDEVADLEGELQEMVWGYSRYQRSHSLLHWSKVGFGGKLYFWTCCLTSTGRPLNVLLGTWTINHGQKNRKATWPLVFQDSFSQAGYHSHGRKNRKLHDPEFFKISFGKLDTRLVVRCSLLVSDIPLLGRNFVLLEKVWLAEIEGRIVYLRIGEMFRSRWARWRSRVSRIVGGLDREEKKLPAFVDTQANDTGCAGNGNIKRLERWERGYSLVPLSNGGFWVWRSRSRITGLSVALDESMVSVYQLVYQ